MYWDEKPREGMTRDEKAVFDQEKLKQERKALGGTSTYADNRPAMIDRINEALRAAFELVKENKLDHALAQLELARDSIGQADLGDVRELLRRGMGVPRELMDQGPPIKAKARAKAEPMLKKGFPQIQHSDDLWIKPCEETQIQRVMGGGDSWWYLVRGKTVLGGSHQDNSQAMLALRVRMKELNG